MQHISRVELAECQQTRREREGARVVQVKCHISGFRNARRWHHVIANPHFIIQRHKTFNWLLFADIPLIHHPSTFPFRRIPIFRGRQHHALTPRAPSPRTNLWKILSASNGSSHHRSECRAWQRSDCCTLHPTLDNKTKKPSCGT